MISHEILDFTHFHQAELPERLAAGNGMLAAATSKPGRSFTWQLTDGQAATYRITKNGMEVSLRASGEAARGGANPANHNVTVEVSPQDWSLYAQELKSCFALLYTDGLKMKSGSFDQFAAWEPTLLAAYFGRPLYDEPPELTDTDGQPLQLGKSFTLDDDPAEIAHFFQTTGFAHFRNVFSPAEIAEFSAIADTASAQAHASDKRSWWATKQDGSQVCCRVTYLNDTYQQIEALRDDPRLQRISDFSGENLLPNPDRLDGYNVVIKHGEIAEGLSDLPWHRDCGMGGHSVLCPGVNVGIQLDAANSQSGQLHFLAGSHHHSNRDMSVEAHWPTVAVDTQPGDVTAHFGHTMHAAPAPSGAGVGRRAMYVGFKRAELDDFVPAGQGYNDVLFQHDEGRIRSPEEVQAAR